MKTSRKQNLYERILAYAINPEAGSEDLTAHELHVYQRWFEAFTSLRNYRSQAETVALLMKRFPGLSRATANRDCGNCIKLFGDISGASKEGYRHLALEMIRDGAAIAYATNDGKTLIKAGLAIERVGGVNKTDPDLPDFSKLEPHQYVLGLPPTLVQMLQTMGQSGRIDLTQVVQNMSHFAQDAVEVEDED